MKIPRTLKAFAADESGASAIEYGIIAAMIAGAIVLGLEAVGGVLVNVFVNVGNAIL
jgi:pilus assembly protein Flp/PilA